MIWRRIPTFHVRKSWTPDRLKMDSKVNCKANRTNSEGLYIVNITQNNFLKNSVEK